MTRTVALVVAWLMAVGSGGPQRSLTVGDLALTATKVERAAQWKMPWGDGTQPWPASAGEQPEYKVADEQHEFAIVFVMVSSKTSGASGALADMSLIDAKGDSHKCAVVRMSARAGARLQLPFSVPKGRAIKALKIKDATVDVEGLSGAQAPGK